MKSGTWSKSDSPVGLVKRVFSRSDSAILVGSGSKGVKGSGGTFKCRRKVKLVF